MLIIHTKEVDYLTETVTLEAIEIFYKILVKLWNRSRYFKIIVSAQNIRYIGMKPQRETAFPYYTYVVVVVTLLNTSVNNYQLYLLTNLIEFLLTNTPCNHLSISTIFEIIK